MADAADVWGTQILSNSYLGAFATAPTTDNNGVTLGSAHTGYVYFNSTSSDAWIWTGATWALISTTVAAENINAADAGEYFTGTTVEAITQELGADIATNLKAVQVIEAAPYTTYGTAGITIPLDNTIPQATEGNFFIAVSITPKAITNRLKLTASIDVCYNSGGATLALFESTAADAIAAAYVPTGTNPAFLVHELAAGVISPLTFNLRFGAGAGNIFVNGDNTIAHYGGISAIRLRVEEFVA